MAKVSMQTKLAMSPNEVWDVVGKFSSIPDWHPMVQSSKLEDGGSIRRLSILGGGEIVERLEKIDSNDRLYRYSIVSGPLPVANYTATLRIKDDPDSKGSILEWSSNFDPSGASEMDAMKSIQSMYQSGFENLRKMFGG